MLARIDHVLAPVMWVCAAALVVMLFVGPIVVAEDKQSAGPSPYKGGAQADGQALFKANCGTCHTLSAAGTSGQVGPKLDGIGVDAATVQSVMAAGPGVMPSFDGTLSPAQRAAVAAFVAKASR